MTVIARTADRKVVWLRPEMAYEAFRTELRFESFKTLVRKGVIELFDLNGEARDSLQATDEQIRGAFDLMLAQQEQHRG